MPARNVAVQLKLFGIMYDQLWDMIKGQALTVEIIIRIISSVRKPRRMDICMDGIQSPINTIMTTTENLQNVKYFVAQTSKPLHPDTVWCPTYSLAVYCS